MGSCLAALFRRKEQASATYEAGKKNANDRYERIKEIARAQHKKLKEGYEPIPEPGKRGQVRIGCCCGAPRDAPYINRLKAELANSYYWSGNCFCDLLFFICNWHPLLGIFLCHPNHPWAKAERLFMTIISWSITMVPSAVISKSFAPEDPARILFVLLLVTVPDVVIGVILYQLSIAETRCPPCAKCWQLITGCMMCIALAFGLFSTSICYLILNDTDGMHWVSMLQPLIKGVLISYISWFPIWLILPCQLGFISNWTTEHNSGHSKAENRIEEELGEPSRPEE